MERQITVFEETTVYFLYTMIEVLLEAALPKKMNI